MTLGNGRNHELRAYALCVALAAAGTSSPATAEDFYAGKEIKAIVDSDPGGTFNAYVRVVAKHIGKYVPGKPTVTVQNMPGAAGLKVANYMANVAPRDGTVIAGTRASVPIGALTNPKEALYDATKFGWVGSVTKELYVGYFWHTAPVQTFEDAQKREAIIGGTGPGTFSIDMAILANEFLGTKLKIVTGYKTFEETNLAMERGETHGVLGALWGSLQSGKDERVRDGLIRFNVQYGFKRDPRLPDVPLYIDYAKTEEARQVIKFMIERLEHGRPYFVPPGVPPERLAILRTAFDKTMKDPEFLKDIEAVGGEVNGPMTGQELEAIVAEEVATPPSVLKKIEGAFSKFKETHK